MYPELAEPIITDAGTGLRRGELFGLRSRNALAKELHVTEQLREETTRAITDSVLRRGTDGAGTPPDTC